METIENKILKLISSDEDLIRTLERIIEVYKEKEKSSTSLKGFEWYEIPANPQILNKLTYEGILKIIYKSASSTYYAPVDVKVIENAIQQYKSYIVEAPQVALNEEVLDKLFEDIVGHEEKKVLLKRGLLSEKPVHFLLVGVPSSAKSMFLEALSHLPNSRLITGSGLSKAGLYDVLFTERPKYLLIDEFEKVDSIDNLGALLSLMQTGIVVETKYGKMRKIQLDTRVIAAANSTKGIWSELLSRFVLLTFREYTNEEFIQVCKKILPKEGVSEELALEIANKLISELNTRDPRKAIQIARLLRMKNTMEVSIIIDILKKQIK